MGTAGAGVGTFIVTLVVGLAGSALNMAVLILVVAFALSTVLGALPAVLRELPPLIDARQRGTRLRAAGRDQAAAQHPQPRGRGRS